MDENLETDINNRNVFQFLPHSNEHLMKYKTGHLSNKNKSHKNYTISNGTNNCLSQDKI